MSIELAVVGHPPPDWIEQGVKQYSKRLPNHWRWSLTRLRPANHRWPKSRRQEEEAKRLRATCANRWLILLDERGKNWTSTQFAQQLSQWQAQHPRISFVIGGADGVAPIFKTQSSQLISLSPMTLAHDLALLLFMEQLYRAFTIQCGHPYHRP